MLPVTNSFTHEYQGCELRFGRGCIDDIESVIVNHGLTDALVICGENVGTNDDLMDPIRDGLGECLTNVFAGTTPEKEAKAAFEALDRAEAVGADVLVGVGGGSSLDVARQASVLAGDGRTLSELRAHGRDGSVSPRGSGKERPPVVVIPTTFAGADVSSGGTVELLAAEDSPTGQPVSLSGNEMPIADFADPQLFETTPDSALAGSAMNGFNKGVETLYARDASPISDATAIHGLSLFAEALPNLFAGEDSTGAMDRAVVASLLVQLGRKISIIHAFGHGLARRYPVQQGTAHAILTPHVLRYLFEQVDARRELLARGLGVDAAVDGVEEVGDRIIERVVEIRDSLEVPTHLGFLPETDEDDIPAMASFILTDGPMERTPINLEPTQAAIEEVLLEAW